MKSSAVKVFILFSLFIFNMACTREVVVREAVAAEKPATQEAAPVYGINLGSADSSQCANGGSLIEIFIDGNVDGALSEGEDVVSSKAICNGAAGQDGQNGQNGSNGSNGQDAPISPFHIADALFPCGSTSNFKEVLLRLENGEVLASFSDNASGHMTRLVLIPNGTYANTDSSGCIFSLESPSVGIRTISWDGRVQNTWNYLGN
jgi:hypothetical protein